MFSIIKENDETKYTLTEYIADTESDIANLPITCLPGSTCIVIETSEVYMLNNQKQWKKL